MQGCWPLSCSSNPDEQAWPNRKCSETQVHPDWSEETRHGDIGLCILDEQVLDVQPVRIPQGASLYGEDLLPSHKTRLIKIEQQKWQWLCVKTKGEPFAVALDFHGKQTGMLNLRSLDLKKSE
eukprot:1145346-Pelagomonas_calceolata.AAC.2